MYRVSRWPESRYYNLMSAAERCRLDSDDVPVAQRIEHLAPIEKVLSLNLGGNTNFADVVQLDSGCRPPKARMAVRVSPSAPVL